MIAYSVYGIVLFICLLADALKLKLDLDTTKFLLGAKLHAKCSVSDTSAIIVNSSSLSFGVQNNSDPHHLKIFPINKSFVHVIDETTVELRHPSVPQSFDKKHLVCYDRTNESLYVENYMEVVFGPAQPNITNCEVYNWEFLNFNWTGSSSINYSAWYRSSKMPEYTRCEVTGVNGCTVDITSSGDEFEGEMMVKVNASNEFGNVSIERLLQLHEIVKPGQVSVSVMPSSEKNSSTTTVFFKAPKAKSMTYSLLVVCGNKTFVKRTVQPVNMASINYEFKEHIHGLPRYSNCTVSMRARPSQPKGFQGPWKHFNFTTPEAVPSAVPRVCTNCFRLIHQANTSSRDAVIYFQPLTPELARGNVSTYRVIDVITSFDQELRASDRPWLTVSGLDSRKNYKLALYAGTRVGFNRTLENKLINIPMSAETLTQPRLDMSIVNDSTILCQWGSVSDARTYTLMWCEAENSNLNSNCKASMNWIELPGHTTHHYINLHTGVAYDVIVGIAVENQRSFRSGVAWTYCKFNVNSGIIQPPIISQHSKVGCCKIVINITKPSCNANNRHITAYQLLYMPTDRSEETRNRIISAASVDVVLVSLEDLLPEREYLVVVNSISAQHAVTSLNATLQLSRTGKGELTSGMFLLISVISVIAILMIAFLFYKFYSYLRYWFTKFRTWLTIVIAPPSSAKVTANNESGVPYSNVSFLPPKENTDDSLLRATCDKSCSSVDIGVPLMANECTTTNIGRLLPVIEQDQDDATDTQCSSGTNQAFDGSKNSLPAVPDKVLPSWNLPLLTEDRESTPLNSGCDFSVGYAPATHVHSNLFSPEQLPNSDPSDVCMNDSYEFDDQRNSNDNKSHLAKQRLLPPSTYYFDSCAASSSSCAVMQSDNKDCVNFDCDDDHQDAALYSKCIL